MLGSVLALVILVLSVWWVRQNASTELLQAPSRRRCWGDLVQVVVVLAVLVTAGVLTGLGIPAQPPLKAGIDGALLVVIGLAVIEVSRVLLMPTVRRLRRLRSGAQGAGG